MQQPCIVVASNDETNLRRNLLISDCVSKAGVPVHVERGAPSAAIAYNRGLDATTAPIVIFAHQDVYFPPGWAERLAQVVAEVEARDPNWALISPFGMSADRAEHRGDVWTTSLSRRVGLPVTEPVPAQSFDELTIILRRASGLRFDETLPLFHLYGTDIVQTARATGLGAYVVNLPTVHNDGFHGRLGNDFAIGYHHVRRKWRKNLPIRTPVLWIDHFGLALTLNRLRAAYSYDRRKAIVGNTTTDPCVFSAQCGWEPAP